MSTKSPRQELLDTIEHLARIAVFGAITETYRTCGNAGCRCHAEGPKHGPHMYINFRQDGKTTGYYVPRAAQEDMRAAVNAWAQLQVRLRELAQMNKEDILARARKEKAS